MIARAAIGTGVIVAALAALACTVTPPPVRVGSKAFTEGVILGDVLTGTLRAAGLPATHRRQLGGTRVLWTALLAGEIDAYVEYSGTLVEEIVPGVGADRQVLAAALLSQGVVIGADLGFENTYAIGMLEPRAAELGVATLSDLRSLPRLRFGFSNEFLDRGDGWPALRAAYDLPQREVRGLDHDVAYRALAAGEIDATDLYSTDAEIAYYSLRVLRDDLGHFPEYRALVLHRVGLDARWPGAAATLASLEESIDASRMAAMNAAVKVQRRTEPQVAAAFVQERFGVDAERTAPGLWRRVGRRLLEHLLLVSISLAAAVAVAVPMGVLAARAPRIGAVLLAITGIVQTVPSLALLVFMVPLLGIGELPALAALFLYGLLPVLRNTTIGLTTIPRELLESADALGLPPRARLRLVEVPLAAAAILGGIKTAAVINVGTATLGALIGAGGFGQPILTGIRLDDTALILEGAVPAALLALAVQAAFAMLERLVVPRGLRS